MRMNVKNSLYSFVEFEKKLHTKMCMYLEKIGRNIHYIV